MRKASVLSLKSVEGISNDKSRFFDSPPNLETFGAPFAQNDSRCFVMNFRDRTLDQLGAAGDAQFLHDFPHILGVLAMGNK